MKAKYNKGDDITLDETQAVTLNALEVLRREELHRVEIYTFGRGKVNISLVPNVTKHVTIQDPQE